jgi:LmbE family N-acetylglucosaminyl deacetylase
MDFRRVLVLAPHTDDGEFGCGGTMARLLREGCDVHYVAFSAAERSVPAEFPRDALRKELLAAAACLGCALANVRCLDFDVRDFPSDRQRLLDTMIAIRDELRPELVLLPSAFDTHQDHAVVYAEGVRAFKSISILGYEVPWNNLSFDTTSFVFLESEDISRKVAALACYRSQANRPYANEEFIRSLARTRGTQIGARYAEAFQVIRWVVAPSGQAR